MLQCTGVSAGWQLAVGAMIRTNPSGLRMQAWITLASPPSATALMGRMTAESHTTSDKPGTDVVDIGMVVTSRLPGGVLPRKCR